MNRPRTNANIVNCAQMHDITVLKGKDLDEESETFGQSLIFKDQWKITREEIEAIETLAVFPGTSHDDHPLRLSGFYPDATEEDKEPPLRAARAESEFDVAYELWTPAEVDGHPGRCTLPVVHGSFTDTVGLPDPRKGTWYIVSAITASANPERQDLLIVYKVIKDPDNPRNILGCLGFTQPNAVKSLLGTDA